MSLVLKGWLQPSRAQGCDRWWVSYARRGGGTNAHATKTGRLLCLLSLHSQGERKRNCSIKQELNKWRQVEQQLTLRRSWLDSYEKKTLWQKQGSTRWEKALIIHTHAFGTSKCQRITTRWETGRGKTALPALRLLGKTFASCKTQKEWNSLLSHLFKLYYC